MTKQEIYDKVCAHLAQQKRPAMVNKNCCYRGEGGTMCAVGCLIPDSMYRPEMDMGPDGTLGNDVNSLIQAFPEVGAMLGADNLGLLDGLQGAHDSCTMPGPLQRRLRDIAAEYEIKAGAEQAITEWSK